MRTKKIRGYKRILKDINSWKPGVIDLDLNVLEQSHRDYAKIWVSPFSDLELSNSVSPQPSDEARRQILEALLDTYDS